MSGYAYGPVHQAGDEATYYTDHGHSSSPVQPTLPPLDFQPTYDDYFPRPQQNSQPPPVPPHDQPQPSHPVSPAPSGLDLYQESPLPEQPYPEPSQYRSTPTPALPTAAATYNPPYAASPSRQTPQFISPLDYTSPERPERPSTSPASSYSPLYSTSPTSKNKKSPPPLEYSPDHQARLLASEGHTVLDIPEGPEPDDPVYRGPSWTYADEVDKEMYDADANYVYESHHPDTHEDPFETEDEESPVTHHYGPAPALGAQLRRHKSRKQIQLTQGNLILDCPVPTKLLGFLNNRHEPEYTTMRYTAVTCDPDDFVARNYTLRQQLAGRQTELFICLTMYNEDEVLFTRTMHGVMKNIAHLCSRTRSKTWGPKGWEKVVVCIVADGRRKCSPRVLDCLAAIGVYQDGVAKNTVNDEEVHAHVYEYTAQLSLDPNLRFKGGEKGLVPCQIIFCLKERNQKKINSHRWFFNAFSCVLKPNICLLLDVGTRPEPKSIYHLWKSFDLNSNVAGACGEICADVKGKWNVGPALLNPLVAAQNFEYKISNILDKPTESVFGFISVLPGAFSAYRYIALQNDEAGNGPLASYFKGEKLLGADADVFTSNMYLAEDRILCFELVAKRNSGWVLKYVKSARGVTDVPTDLAELISQRRRWLNGSFFAGLYSLVHTPQLFHSNGHSTFRKTLLMIQTAYSCLNLFFSWFIVGNMFCFFAIITQGLEAPTFHLPHINILNTAVQYIYIGTLVSCFIFALGNRPQGSRWKYYTVASIFAVLMTYMLIAAVVCFVHVLRGPHDAMYGEMIISILATYGVYVISSIIALDPSFIITSMLPYILLSPTWANVLNVYAFCNLHDFSWGTKGDHTVANDLGKAIVASKGEQKMVELDLPHGQADIDAAYDDALLKLRTRPAIMKGPPSSEDKDIKRMDYYRSIRTNVVLCWVLSNILLMAIILGSGGRGSAFDSGNSSLQRVFMVVILIWVAIGACIRFICSTAYATIRLLGG